MKLWQNEKKNKGKEQLDLGAINWSIWIKKSLYSCLLVFLTKFKSLSLHPKKKKKSVSVSHIRCILHFVTLQKCAKRTKDIRCEKKCETWTKSTSLSLSPLTDFSKIQFIFFIFRFPNTFQSISNPTQKLVILFKKLDSQALLLKKQRSHSTCHS